MEVSGQLSAAAVERGDLPTHPNAINVTEMLLLGDH